jgi:hypothetical protein
VAAGAGVGGVGSLSSFGAAGSLAGVGFFGAENGESAPFRAGFELPVSDVEGSNFSRFSGPCA